MEFSISREKILHEGRFKTVEQEIRCSDGRSLTHETVKHPGAVVIVPVVAPNRVLLVRQYRYSLGEWILEFPAGTLEAGEDPRTCAARELIEEVQQEAGELKDLGILYPAPGFCNEKQFLFIASGLRPCSSGKLDEDEMIEIVEWEVSLLERQIRDFSIVDGKTVAAFCRARLAGLL